MQRYECTRHKRCRRCPVSIDLYMLRKARRNLFFYPPKHGDPPPTTSKVIAPLCHPLLLRSPSLRSTQRSPPTAALQYYSTTPCIKQGGRVARYRSLCSVLYSGGGSGSLPTSVCLVLYNRGGAGLCCPLCSVFYITAERGLSTVPYVRIYIAGGDSSLPSPVFAFI